MTGYAQRQLKLKINWKRYGLDEELESNLLESLVNNQL
jgi:hypothetical protein